MAKELMLVVGQDPLSNLIGFNTEETYDYGSCILDKINNELVTKLTVDTGTDASVLNCAGLTGSAYTLTSETGVALSLTGTAGAYTGSLTAFKTAMNGHLNGVFNMMFSVLAAFVSGGTVDTTTIALILDETADVTDATNWSVDLNAGTPNVITDVQLSGTTVLITVTDVMLNTDVITVSHTAATGDEVGTITAGAIVNNI